MGTGFSDAVDAARSSRALGQLIERALDALTEPVHARAIARLAFDSAPEDLDHHDPEQLALFVHGPLAEAVEAVLGVDAIDVVCAHVAGMSQTLPPIDRQPDDKRGALMVQRDGSDTLRTGPRPIVLLVSADDTLCDQIDPWLSEAGYALVWCCTPDTVVAQCTTILPQLVIVDEDMPGLMRRKLVGLMKHALRDDAPPLIAVGRLTPESTKGLEAFARRPLERVAFVAAVNRIAHSPESHVSPPPSPVPEGDDEGARLSYLLEEAMGRLVAAPVRDAIITDALSRGGLSSIPSDVVGFTEFVVGPLAEAVGHGLGEDLTNALLADLEPIVLQAREASGLQRRPDAVGPTNVEPPPSERRRRHHILVVADDAADGIALAHAIEERGHRADEVDDAHDALERCVERPPDAVLVRLRRAAVTESQFCALLALTLGAERPPVLVITERALGSTPGADRVTAPTPTPGSVVDELVDLLASSGGERQRAER